MAQVFSIVLSVAALAISALTAWLTLFQRGTVRMTQPTVIFLGPDGRPPNETPIAAKVYLRSLLYATSKRGRIVESMFVRLHRSESNQTFSIWVYGEKSLARGSGLFVGEGGLACNHHFLPLNDGTTFSLLPGDYTLEVYARLVGDVSAVKLFSTGLVISPQEAERLKQPNAGIYFDWHPESHKYYSHIDSKPLVQMRTPSFLLDFLEKEHQGD